MFVSLNRRPRVVCAIAVLCAIVAGRSSAEAQTAPVGWVDTANWHHIAGWAADADISSTFNYPSSCGGTSTGGIVVHAYVWPVDAAGNVTGPQQVYGAMSNQCRCDVPCHGFDIALPALTPGRYMTSVYALGVNSSVTPGQYGHPGNLDGNNALLFGSPKFFEVPTRTLTYQGFTCDVFGATTKEVMVNDYYRVAYDFNVTKLSESSYVSVFHAERYELNGGAECTGDSVAARYATTPDGHFGTRTGGSDKIVTTTSAPSTFMWNNPSEQGPACQDNVSGGGNPILLYTGTPGDPNQSSLWSVLWLSVAKLATTWSHYLHLGNASNINDLIGANWNVLAENGGFPWAQFNGAPVYRNYNPTPVRNTDQSFVKSAYDSTGDTQGLIGNISRDASLANAYFFYLDVVPLTSPAGAGCPAHLTTFYPNHCMVTMRRKMLTPTWPNWWEAPVRAFYGWAQKVAYHPGRGRWMVFYQCGDGPCIQFAGPGVDSVTDQGTDPNRLKPLGGNDDVNFRFNFTSANPSNSQWGFLKNAYGQVASDDFRLYYRPGPEGNNYGGTQIRSMRISCQ